MERKRMRPTEPMIVPRKPLAIAAGVLAVLLMGTAGFLMLKAYGSGKPAPAADAATLDPLTGEPAAYKPPVQNQTELAISGVAAALGALVAAGFALTMLFNAPTPDPSQRQAQDRLHLLVFGGLLGGILVLLGFALFYCWFGELAAWLNKDDKAKVWKPLTAILVFLVGAATMFLAAQPARGDERHNSGVRRAVYGVNLALSAVLVFALLLVVNIAVGMKLPARLDTTESGLYSLSPNTQGYLQQLTTDITIYSTVPDSGRLADVARLLGSLREANPQRIRLRPLAQDMDKAEIDALKAKYKSTDLTDPADGSVRMGLLVAAGAGDKATFINADELFGRTQGQRGAQGRLQFQGESRILREVLFLTENKAKAVVYFTQGAGEIAIARDPAGGEIGLPRMGEQLKAQLAADGTEVKALVFDPTNPNPKVPDDATLVIVADPRTTLSETSVNALRTFMQAKKPDGSTGKLIVMAGARTQPGTKAILKTGLEELLDEFGVVLPGRALYAQPTNQYPADTVQVQLNPNLLEKRNPIALAYIDTGFAVAAARPVVAKPRGNPAMKVDPLLVNLEDRVTWYEESVAANPTQAFLDLRTAGEKGDAAYLQQRSAARAGRSLAVIVSEAAEDGKTTHRLAVFGFGNYFEDKAERRNFPAEFLATTVNWLRDRPAVANEANKTYGVYEPNRKMSWNQVFLMPVGVTVIGLATLGLGLWAWRRK
jgi:hypothetical protein